MSQDNVEILRRAIDAWNAGDLEGLIELCDPDVKFIPLRSQLDGAPYRGPDGTRQFARDATEQWEFLRIADLRFPCGWVAELRDERLLRVRAYSNPHDALEALGRTE